MYLTEEIFNNLANSENVSKKFYKVHNAIFEDRVKVIKNLLRLDHLNIHEILDQLGNEQYFSVFDLASGFHQIKMSPEDFHTKPNGQYEFDRMPFGLFDGPATFQRLINITLSGFIGTDLSVYFDVRRRSCGSQPIKGKIE